MNKRQRKKRMKKLKLELLQLQNKLKEISPATPEPMVLLNPDDIERVAIINPPRMDLYLGKYENRKANKLYQLELDQVYGAGMVVPIEKFNNHKSSLLHYCHDCKKEFFSRPDWLLTRDNQRHVCHVDTSRANAKKVKKKVTEKDVKKMVELFEQGFSKSKIAMHTGISRPTVIKHLSKVGL